jgi:hypothetical protein
MTGPVAVVSLGAWDFSSLVSEDDCAAARAAMAIMKSAEAAYDLRQRRACAFLFRRLMNLTIATRPRAFHNGLSPLSVILPSVAVGGGCGHPFFHCLDCIVRVKSAACMNFIKRR